MRMNIRQLQDLSVFFLQCFFQSMILLLFELCSYLELIYEIQKNIDINKMIVHNHKQFIKTYLDKNRLN